MAAPIREKSFIDSIRAIFYSGTHAFAAPEELVSEIAFLVDEGYLHVREEQIATREEYARAVEGISSKGDYDADGGGIPHIALKRIAATYISRTYDCDVTFETPFCGFVPDVISTDRAIVAECGHTNNPDKMLTYFRDGNIAACIQIPYPDLTDTHIVAYIFTADDTLNGFLNALAEDRNAKLKRLIVGQ